MTGFREGQRVRVTFEGELIRGDITGALYVADSGGIALLNGNDGPTESAEAATSIEILADPKPDEPTGLYAVVRDLEDEDPTPWVRDDVVPGRPWWRFAKGQSLFGRQWADFSDRVEVLFPGVES